VGWCGKPGLHKQPNCPDFNSGATTPQFSFFFEELAVCVARNDGRCYVIDVMSGEKETPLNDMTPFSISKGSNRRRVVLLTVRSTFYQGTLGNMSSFNYWHRRSNPRRRNEIKDGERRFTGMLKGSGSAGPVGAEYVNGNPVREDEFELRDANNFLFLFYNHVVLIDPGSENGLTHPDFANIFLG
jgi:hypothetical protein